MLFSYFIFKTNTLHKRMPMVHTTSCLHPLHRSVYGRYPSIFYADLLYRICIPYTSRMIVYEKSPNSATFSSANLPYAIIHSLLGTCFHYAPSFVPCISLVCSLPTTCKYFLLFFTNVSPKFPFFSMFF